MSVQSYRRGVIYAIVAGLFLSTAGLLVRYIDTADAWTILFYRSCAFSVSVLVFMIVRDGKRSLQRYRELEWIDLIVATSLAFGFIFYVLSLFNTSVANTVLLLSTGPFFAALLGWLVLRESVGVSTILMMILALAGVAVMVRGDVSTQDLWGMGYAIAAVSAFAIMIVALRYAGADRDSLAATSLAGILAAAIALCFVVTLQISSWDLLMALSLGTVQIGVGFILITLATRSVPSAQVPLYALGETALAPLWVWWIIDEVPSRNTLIGGGLVLLAVALKGLEGVRESGKQ